MRDVLDEQFTNTKSFRRWRKGNELQKRLFKTRLCKELKTAGTLQPREEAPQNARSAIHRSCDHRSNVTDSDALQAEKQEPPNTSIGS